MVSATARFGSEARVLRGASVILFLACVWLSSAGSAAAQPSSASGHAAKEPRYAALVRAAVDEYNRANWGEARLLFGKAHAISPNARTWRGIGLTEYESKRYVEAIAALESALSDRNKPLSVEQRRDTERALHEARQFAAVYALQVPEGVTEAVVDGEAAPLPADGKLLLNPGRHTIAIRSAAGTQPERSVDVVVGERRKLVFDALPPRASTSTNRDALLTPAAAGAEASSGGRVWTWVAAGTTLALAAGTVAFGMLAVNENDRFKELARAGKPSAEARRDGQRYQLISNAGIGVTAAAAIGTLVLVFVETGPAQESLSVSIGPGALQLRGHL